MSYAARNTLYVRHLSPQITEGIIRETFEQCDAIERVLFRSFQGRSAEFFAQIDFKSSRGVLEGHKMSGTKILGQTVEVSVMDPGGKELGKQMWAAQRPWETQPDAEDVPEAPTEPQGVQAEAFRKFKEMEEDKRLRTVHIAGLKKDVSEENVRILCTQFGDVEAMRVDKDAEGEMFALVEFKERGPATVVKQTEKFKVDDMIITFTEAKTMVDTTSFAEQSVHFNQPAFDPTTLKVVLAAQCHLNPKIAKARMAAAEIMNEPIPEDLLKEKKAKEEEPFVWAGRSEKESLVPSASQRGWDRNRGRDDSRSRSGRRRRDGDRRSRSRRKRRKKDKKEKEEDAREAAAAKAIEAATEGKPKEDDDDIAVAAELVVLGESDSYSEGSPSPERDLKAKAEEEAAAKAKAEAEAAAKAKADAEAAEAAAIAAEREKKRKEAEDELCVVGSTAHEKIAAALIQRRLSRLESGETKEDLVPKEKWECAKCGEVNKPTRRACNNCGARAPWVTEEFEVDDAASTSSSASSSKPPSPVKRRRRRNQKDPSPPKDIEDSPLREIEDSPARSIAGSSPRSIAESCPEEIDDEPEKEAQKGGQVDSSGEEDVVFEKENVSGEMADARARIFHGC
eukprot:TRINITY_DN18435_c1_g1_i1.p1 TRINITY_DN18435_c1_g1~~TRINITY_DN18435_c1_g1_i1.p1  ORF type:complete len:623 (-),score=175.75 TRINITY_DN18435_c1_g1_i1:111-1979(-)